MDFYEDDGESHTTRHPFKATGYPFLTFLRAVFEELGGEPFCAADDEGADEAAVDDAGGFAEDHFKLGILLVQDIYPANGILLRDQGFDGLFVAVQGDAEDGCIPLLAQVGRHLGYDEGFAHLVSGGDTLYTAFLKARDLIDEFCHIESFSAKITGPSAEIRRKLRNSVKNGNILADCSAQLELLPFSFVDVAEEMPLGLGLQDEVQDVRRAQVIVQDTVRRPVRNQNVDVVWDVFIGNPGVSGDGANDNSVAVLYSILKDYDSCCLKLFNDCLISAPAERQFMIARHKQLPFCRKRPEPGDEIVILATF